MSDSVYSFRAGPTYRAASRQELFDSAMEQPLSLTSTFFDQAKGGMLESYGLGTAIRDFAIPEGVATPGTTVRSALRLTNPLTAAYESTRLAVQAFREDSPVLDEAKYKSSPWYRENIPWDAGMTEARAKALAEWNDAKQVRQYYAQKRPISAFLGNLTGQAFDPINYVPVGGPLVRAAAVARAGRIGGAVITGAVDAATNTALAGLATRETRGRFGDDVSFQAMVSEIATAALIGAAFGGVSGAMEARTAARALADAQRTLSTLKATQEARIALNEAIDGVVRGEDITLSPNATEAAVRAQQEIIAYHGSPHTFDAFSTDKIGTGEGAQAFGRGLYFAEKEAVAISYRDDITKARVSAAERALKKAGGDIDAAILAAKSEIERLRNLPDGGGDVARRDSLIAINEDKIAELTAQKATGAATTGNIYEVAIKADPEDFLEWDKPLSEQSPKIRAALSDMKPEWTGGQIYESSRLVPGEFHDKKAATEALLQRGIAGIRYLDQDSRSAGNGSRNIVVFDDRLVSIRSRNGRPLDTSPARPVAAPEGRALAETRIAKPDNYKALADQYRVDPETGDFPELADIDNLRAEGRLTADDIAELDAAASTVDDAKAYGEALKTVVGCLL